MFHAGQGIECDLIECDEHHAPSRNKRRNSGGKALRFRESLQSLARQRCHAPLRR
jgi:hypothetical protein